MAEFPPGGQAQFFTDFAPTLLRKMRGVLYLVIEEAHLFAPKERSGIGQENMSIHWAKTLAQAGRSKGIRLMVLTQRTQALHNAMLGSCDTLIAHRLTAPADQLPVLKWLQANTDKKTSAAVGASLSSLKKGEAWLCAGEAHIFERRKFPLFSTFDNTKTPEDGDGDVRVEIPMIDVDALKHLIGNAVAEAEASDPRKLKDENARLKIENSQLKSRPVPVGAKSMSSEQEKKLDTLIELLTKQHQRPNGETVIGKRAEVVRSATAETRSGPIIDEEAMYLRFKARLMSEVSFGSGGATFTVTPPEKLRKDFQREEADRIVEIVRGLVPLGKRTLKLLEAVEGKSLSQREINLRLGRSASSARDMANAVKEMQTHALVSVDSHGVATAVRRKIADDLNSYQPAAEEIDDTYQRVLYEIATNVGDE